MTVPDQREPQNIALDKEKPHSSDLLQSVQPAQSSQQATTIVINDQSSVIVNESPATTSSPNRFITQAAIPNAGVRSKDKSSCVTGATGHAQENKERTCDLGKHTVDINCRGKQPDNIHVINTNRFAVL